MLLAKFFPSLWIGDTYAVNLQYVFFAKRKRQQTRLIFYTLSPVSVCKNSRRFGEWICTVFRRERHRQNLV